MIIDLNLAKVSVGSEVPISEDDDQNIVSELSKINSFPDFLLPVSKSSNYSSDLCLLILDHDMPNNDLIAPIGDAHFDDDSQCGNFRIYLYFRFYVKSILENLCRSFYISWGPESC